jgi:quercetin dioxygenase-like cupin family protein
MRLSRAICLVVLLYGGVGLGPALSGTTPPAGFIQVLPPDIKWVNNPVVPGGQTAILLGDPKKALPLVIRIKLPPNSKIMPHTHPESRTYTVLAGEWKLGFGTQYDSTELRTFPAGSIYRLPAAVPHFQATGSHETIVQIESQGPTRTDFIGHQ